MRRTLPAVPLIASVLTLAVLPSCFMQRQTTNEPVVRETVAALKPGVSTAEDVVAALGAPTEVVQLAQRSAYRYEFSQRKTAGFTVIVLTLLNSDLRSDRVWVFFDADDVLTHVATSFEGDAARYAMPWMQLHDEGSPAPAPASASDAEASSAEPSKP